MTRASAIVVMKFVSPTPAWKNVKMDVVDNTCARSSAEIHSYIETLR